MPTTLNGISASPTTISPGQTSLVSVDATAASDKTFRIVGKVVGTDDVAEVAVTLDNPGITYSLDPQTARDGDVLLTTPDGGRLTPVSGQPGKFTFAP